MELVVHPPGRGFILAGDVHNSAGTGKLQLDGPSCVPRVVDSLSPDMSTVALGQLGITA